MSQLSTTAVHDGEYFILRICVVLAIVVNAYVCHAMFFWRQFTMHDRCTYLCRSERAFKVAAEVLPTLGSIIKVAIKLQMLIFEGSCTLVDPSLDEF
jgi:hypothetical protein